MNRFRRSGPRAIALAVIVPLVATLTAGPTPAAPAPIVPAEVHIPAIGVDAPVIPVGTVMEKAPFLGGDTVSTFGVPPDGTSVGWWSDGPLVGGPGMAVMLGHTQVGGSAVFNRLGDLHPGDEVSIDDAGHGIETDFRITHVVAGIEKSRPDALQRVLAENAPTSQLALITCGGAFDAANNASVDNTVAFASLSGSN